jgi:membrane-associated phospholipid phosphatase
VKQRISWGIFFLFTIVWQLQAQDSAGGEFIFQLNAPAPAQKPVIRPCSLPLSEKTAFTNVWCDQKAIWGAVIRPDRHWKIAAPFTLATATLIATDKYAAKAIAENPPGKTFNIATDISKISLTAVTWGLATSMYAAGRFSHKDRMKDTGLLVAESYLNVEIVKQLVKRATNRKRPADWHGNIKDNARGRFWTGDGSFPAGHAMEAWANAAVLSHQYREKPVVKYIAYSVAIVVSGARIASRAHFNSDVVFGSIAGYLIGKYVARTHRP